MKATIDKDGYLKLEAGSIIESLDEASLRAFAKYAVFQEHLLRGVADALVSGQMWEDDDEPPWWFGGDTLNNLRLKLLPLLPAITAEAVRHLERQTREAHAQANTWREACWALERDWPEARDMRRGIDGEYHRPLTREQAAEYLRNVEEKLAAASKEHADGRP